MFDRLDRLYRDGRIDAEGLERAVSLAWITAEQAAEIMGHQQPDELGPEGA